MKARQPHRVPLASQVVAILRELHPLTGRGRYVFPGARSARGVEPKGWPPDPWTPSGAGRAMPSASGRGTGKGGDMTTFSDIKKRWLQDPEMRAEYDALE